MCWFFGGLFGAHRFLVGRPVSGFVWMFTLGLFGVGWLVDALILPALVEEHNKKVFNRLMLETSSVFFDSEPYAAGAFYAPQGGPGSAFAGAVAPYAQNVYFPPPAGGQAAPQGGRGYEPYY